ncbi:NAD(P)H:quinone oxidoreductase [Alkalibacter mobilis]|uniref:NAD(P)H:quinone oxidoreductase n=1 Tax=Alkalibacter mobilis TaxID=2787712 RepID=UPI00189C5A19|nr:NAD(P)H:quinone oxidoreductase [Alkalibacter mobilis]MBF7097723.1 NAD(P)H:quinone oxidoreductase [Alkalibacter mobilis]
MGKVKLAVIFYSMTGANYQMAKWATEAGQDVGAEVRLLKVQELAPDSVIEANSKWKETKEEIKDIPVAKSEDIEWADALVFSVPTRFGNMASQMKQFLDIQGGIWSQGKTVDKVVTAMSSAQNPHGGQEGTIKALYASMMHWGAVIVPPGYTDESLFKAGGNPYGTSTSVGSKGEILDDVEDAVKHQVKRAIKVAGWIKTGKQ